MSIEYFEIMSDAIDDVMEEQIIDAEYDDWNSQFNGYPTDEEIEQMYLEDVACGRAE